jgi:hypothetical protein
MPASTSPLFVLQGGLAFNAALTAEIERLGYSVFLPRRDGVDETGEAGEPKCVLRRNKAAEGTSLPHAKIDDDMLAADARYP